MEETIGSTEAIDILFSETTVTLEQIEKNIKDFSAWIDLHLTDTNLYELFCKTFGASYRSQLFEDICDSFKNSILVTDDVLFNWKGLIVHLLKNSKKYKSFINDLVFNPVAKKTNLRLVKDKHTFKCFIDDEFICYFKENGNDYYVS